MTQPFIPPTPKQFTLPQNGELIEYQGRLYRIGPALGHGAFGAVYECSDEWGNALVAKVMLPLNRTYDDVKDGWIRELTNLVHLRHPNITYVYDAFEYQDTFYLIIERCMSSLNDLMAMPQFNGAIWLPYVASDVLQGLSFIHDSGYVHKDLHSGNVFVASVQDKMVPTKEPVIMFKVGDLGISKLESEMDFFQTVLAQWMLPPEFLAPLQFGLLGRQVDIYHVGLLLLRMLLNQEPQFTHEQILAGEPRRLAENLNSPFAPAISKALRRHVTDRTQTPLEMWRDILGAIQ